MLGRGSDDGSKGAEAMEWAGVIALLIIVIVIIGLWKIGDYLIHRPIR